MMNATNGHKPTFMVIPRGIKHKHFQCQNYSKTEGFPQEQIVPAQIAVFHVVLSTIFSTKFVQILTLDVGH